MLTQKREQAYYDVFSSFLKQTLKEKKQIEERIFVLQQLVSNAERCLKINSQKLDKNCLPSYEKCEKYGYSDIDDCKIVLLRKRILVQHAKLIMAPSSESRTNTATGKQEEMNDA